MGSELRGMTLLPLFPNFFIINFVRAEPFIIDGESARFGVQDPSSQRGQSDQFVELEKCDKLTGTVMQLCLEISLQSF